jgi:hypothetical protein
MNPKWLDDPDQNGPAYFVPASALRDVGIGRGEAVGFRS